jgi:glycosyltransferase involved in cell wall biosynthesis
LLKGSGMAELIATHLRLLYLPQCRLSHELGGSKVQLALAEHLRPLGWQVECRFPFDPGNPCHRAELAGVDVIDWDPHHSIQRAWLPDTSLSICRFPLLALHFQTGVPWPLPRLRRLDPFLNPLRRLRGRMTPKQAEQQALQQALQALGLADAVAVQNTADQHCLLNTGLSPESIVVEPCGLPQGLIHALHQVPAPPPSHAPLLSFVGSFDPRKGCIDLVWLARRLGRRFPQLRFRFIGTDGLIQGESNLRRWFPGWLQPRLELIPSFTSAQLAELLCGVNLAVFPSYLEGFGIAVIEQLTAGIPVIAYAAPGPADILPADWLVPRGDRQGLLQRLSALLASPSSLRAARARARSIAAPYRWNAIASHWDGHYRRLLAGRRA